MFGVQANKMRCFLYATQIAHHFAHVIRRTCQSKLTSLSWRRADLMLTKSRTFVFADVNSLDSRIHLSYMQLVRPELGADLTQLPCLIYCNCSLHRSHRVSIRPRWTLEIFLRRRRRRKLDAVKVASKGPCVIYAATAAHVCRLIPEAAVRPLIIVRRSELDVRRSSPLRV
jgi:hypothetical protein